MTTATAPGTNVAHDFKPEQVINSLREFLNPYLTSGIQISDKGMDLVVTGLREDGYFDVATNERNTTITELPCNKETLGLVLDQWANVTGRSRASGITKDVPV